MYEAIDGRIHKLSSRAARGEPADDSTVSDVFLDLDDQYWHGSSRLGLQHMRDLPETSFR